MTRPHLVRVALCSFAVVVGCTPDVPTARGAVGDLRPIVREWSGDGLWLDSPLWEVPLAYVSMERREVYVDRAFRDRASWLLDAHISVSTGLWRIRLPGDPSREPITPGDEIREFEELDIGRWNPGAEPRVGDIRIVRGDHSLTRVSVACRPVSGVEAGGERWWSATLFAVPVRAGAAGSSSRQDFARVGIVATHPTVGCGQNADSMAVYGWGPPVP